MSEASSSNNVPQPDDSIQALLTISQVMASGDAVEDMGLVESLSDKLKQPGIESEKAMFGLVYLMLSHRSALVRHEAAFTIGDSGRSCTFLDVAALHDPEPVVRHEACLAMGAKGNRHIGKYHWLLEWIADHDKSEMVRHSALYALSRLSET
jgi:HEAT repeat protein